MLVEKSKGLVDDFLKKNSGAFLFSVNSITCALVDVFEAGIFLRNRLRVLLTFLRALSYYKKYLSRKHILYPEFGISNTKIILLFSCNVVFVR